MLEGSTCCGMSHTAKGSTGRTGYPLSGNMQPHKCNKGNTAALKYTQTGEYRLVLKLRA